MITLAVGSAFVAMKLQQVQRYRIDASVDGTAWTLLVDASAADRSGWEDWTVTASARYLRFTGLSNSKGSPVLVAELEVYGPPPGGQAKNMTLVQASEPVSVLTSDGPQDESGWNAVDGNLTTAWIGQKAGGGYLVVEYAPTLQLNALEVDLAASSLTNIQYLYSLDALEWQPLPEGLATNPVSLNFLWLLFPDDGSSATPNVLEIWPNP